VAAGPTAGGGAGVSSAASGRWMRLEGAESVETPRRARGGVEAQRAEGREGAQVRR
jgi:hypothetical protein